MISDIGIFYGIEPTALLIKKREIDFGKSEVLSPLVSGGSGTPFSMGAYGGIYKTYRTLSDLGETGYVKSRDSLETVLETFTTGAYLRMDVTEHTYVKLGMEYQSIAERLQYAFIADSTITENVVEFNATVLKEWRNYNHHRLVNVPLTIGYEINLGQWHLVAEGTSVVSVRKSFSGLMLDRGGELSSGVDQFSTGMSFAGRLALGIGYELENLSFHCLPTFQKHFGSFSEITTGYDQEYQMLGIQLGVNYHFKR